MPPPSVPCVALMPREKKKKENTEYKQQNMDLGLNKYIAEEESPCTEQSKHWSALSLLHLCIARPCNVLMMMMIMMKSLI